jgi:hypothetical protein
MKSGTISNCLSPHRQFITISALNLCAFVRDIRTFVSDDNAELHALMQNIHEVMNEPGDSGT